MMPRWTGRMSPKRSRQWVEAERSALRSRIATMLEHLIKLRASAALDPRNGWKETIGRAGDDIEGALIDSLSMRTTGRRDAC